MQQIDVIFPVFLIKGPSSPALTWLLFCVWVLQPFSSHAPNIAFFHINDLPSMSSLCDRKVEIQKETDCCFHVFEYFQAVVAVVFLQIEPCSVC